jgi:cobalt-zinc-cadmium efflux system protein
MAGPPLDHHAHDHAHGHDENDRGHEREDKHDHDHAHGVTNERLLGWAIAITAVFMVIEFAAGLLAKSLALVADAGHMLTDTAALTLAFAAMRLAARPADTRRSFGYQRLQVLATFVNGFALFAIVGWIVFEAVQRLMNPPEINAHLMLLVGTLGAIVNVIVYLMLRGDHHHNMNMAAASLHVLGDFLGSIAAVIAAIAISYTGWTPIDPILSVIVSLMIVGSAWSLVRKSTHILLEGAPDWLNVSELRSVLTERVPAVCDIHHVHCWSLGTRETLITLHASVTEGSQNAQVLQAINQVLADRFGITHATIQIEFGACADVDCTPSVVDARGIRG